MRAEFFPLVRRMVAEARRDREMWEEMELQDRVELQLFSVASMGLKEGGARGGERGQWPVGNLRENPKFSCVWAG